LCVLASGADGEKFASRETSHLSVAACRLSPAAQSRTRRLRSYSPPSFIPDAVIERESASNELSNSAPALSASNEV
jgi:hypothetical protein